MQIRHVGFIRGLLITQATQAILCSLVPARVPVGSPSRGGDVAGYVPDINQTSLPTPFYSALVSVSAFMALSTVFHSINSRNNCIRSITLFFWSFPASLVLSTIYLSMKVSLSPDVIYCG